MRCLQRALVCLFLIALACPPSTDAQNVTTGTLSGLVKDAQGGILPGAVVTAVHVPTGTSYEAVSQSDGRFSILNVRVGSPYRVTVTMSGFQTVNLPNLAVTLGEKTDVPITLQLEQVSVTVQVESSSIFTSSKAGATENIPTGVIETLPTINRSLQDIARISPYFNQTQSDAFASALSVAGRNVRYNSIQIDGAVNNDVFSIASGAGTPGGQTETQPISFDVIQELQLVVSPYDVRQGMFSGGGVNAITRSGTNAFHGSGFYVFRNQSLVGDGIDNRPIATFNDKQFGGTIGGPIARNKAFFLGNVEWGRKSTPVGYSISGTSGVSYGHEAEAERFRNILVSRYGYDPGGFDEFIRDTNNNKFFVRTDFNLSGSQLTVRHNYVDGFNDVGAQDNVSYKFPDNFYRQHSTTNSTVGQLNSSFGRIFNEARVTYQRIRDYRSTEARFPTIRVDLPGNLSLNAGTENSSHANELDQDTVEVTDDVTMVRGSHTFTFGTHNEFFKFRNLFTQNLYGNYRFSSLDNLEAGVAGGYSYGFSTTGDPFYAPRFKVYQFGLYAGDQWAMASRFTLTYGVRWDKPVFPTTPTANPLAESAYGYATDVVPSPASWSPRAGFNWDLSTTGVRQQLRGGVGMFSGRNPFVFLSNQYVNTGNEFRRINVNFAAANNITFIADPDAQPPTNLPTASSNEIDVIDPEYQFPRIMRTNLAYDRSLPWGLVANVEVMYTNTLKDVTYQNLNLVETRQQEDGRPFYGGRVNPAVSDFLLLTNTKEGNSWSIATELQRQLRNNFFAKGSYLYGRSTSVSDTTNSTARSTWLNVYTPGDINHARPATSNFDVGHRFTLSGSYLFDLKKANVTVSMYYNSQTGRPYSYLYGSDVNGDGSTTNDLLWYPNQGDVAFSGAGTYQDLVNFLEGGDCEDVTPGEIVKRNTCRMPWVNTLDFRTAVDVPIGKWRPEFTMDILNLLNLFDSTKGQVLYAPFNDLLVSNATSTAAGQYTYTVNAIALPGGTRFTRDDLRSRWQMQFGLRFRF